MNNKEASTQAVGQNEKTILAYFKSAHDAEKAGNELQQAMNLAKENLKIDQFNTPNGTGDGNDTIFNPISGDVTSHATMVGGLNDISAKDVGILLQSDPAVAGMSDGSMQTITGRNFQMVAIVPKDQVEKALNVIEKHNGQH